MDASQYNSGQNTPVVTVTPQPTSKRHFGRWLMTAAIVLAVGIASILWVSRDSSSDAVLAAPAATIEINASGFVPQTIRIKKGQGVTWTNRDTAPHHIMANPFPSGGSLVTLNSGEPLVKNDTYTASFDTAGTYNYHDVLNPALLNGTVIVE